MQKELLERNKAISHSEKEEKTIKKIELLGILEGKKE